MSRQRKSTNSERRKPRTVDEQPELFEAKAATAEDAEIETIEEADTPPPPRSFRTRAFNVMTGLFYAPFAWVFTDALFDAFANARPGAVRVPFYMTHEFLTFAAGAGLWLLWTVFCVLVWKRPRPVRVYVWGHEHIHMLLAVLSGGRIKAIHYSADGGYIVTDRYNSLIALAPYLWPFACVPVLALWGVWWMLGDPMAHRGWPLAALGFTWAFHLTFTVWMLPKGQSDFHQPGRVFSFVVIYLVNIVLLSAALVALAPEVTLDGWWRELDANLEVLYKPVFGWFRDLWRVIAGR